ncbi:MAG TPA: hemolysin family protein [Gammaproteobacteria bacterium]|nr:hemolysin family protein [Gammaproteobacteria bacterium]
MNRFTNLFSAPSNWITIASVISAAIVIQLLGAENKFVNLFIMVPILLLVGEITPKTLAIRNNVAFAAFQSYYITLFADLISPLRWLVRQVADWVTTLIVGKERSRANIVTEDMVRTLAREAVGEGVLNPLEARYIDHIFEFGDKTVEDVMTPRSNVFFLPAEMSLEEMLQELRRTRRTKVPVFHEHRNNILGVLYARDLLGMEAGELSRLGENTRQLLRPPYFVPETKRAADLFHTFRKRKLSLALVVDEYGGVTGLVSMEDLLECIFGDLPSASDTVSAARYRKLTDGSAHIEGGMQIEQFNREFSQHLPGDVAETVGGLVLDRFGELPVAGAKLLIDGLEFVVEMVEGNRIMMLAVTAQVPAAAADAAAEGIRAPGALEAAPPAEPGGDPATREPRQ